MKLLIHRASIWMLLFLIIVVLPMSKSEEETVRQSLLQFLQILSDGNPPKDIAWGWNNFSDPCNSTWKGVRCRSQRVSKIVLEKFNFNGTIDATSVCKVKSLVFLSLKGNNISGLLPEEIRNCKRLTHLYVSGNRLSGSIPTCVSQLGNLKKLDLSNNDFSGQLLKLSPISGILSFLVENNQFTGPIPDLDFSNVMVFNVSNNNFSGPIPDVQGKFTAESFLGNPALCGKPLPDACPPSAPPLPQPFAPSIPPFKKETKRSLKDQILAFSGFIMLLLVAILLIALKLASKKMPRRVRSAANAVAMEAGSKPSDSSSIGQFDLRIKDWDISLEDLKRKMRRIDQVRHPRVLSAVAFYCSKEEKLLVYEYYPNGSLFKLLHGSKNGPEFYWGSRLRVAANIAGALVFMHNELHCDKIAHGNLKSTNILFDNGMEPCISEYGLMVDESLDQSFLCQSDSFKNNALNGGHVFSPFMVDIYSSGVIFLELLTGKFVQNNGFDLARWVQTVVREEWTGEVFDRRLIAEGANEERMLSLLSIALQCINPSPNERPSMNQVASMVHRIKEEEERSISSSVP